MLGVRVYSSSVSVVDNAPPPLPNGRGAFSIGCPSVLPFALLHSLPTDLRRGACQARRHVLNMLAQGLCDLA